MQIANPIYDVVFKYLMDDNKIAKKLLSLIIGHEIVDLKFQPTEVRSEIESSHITVMRMDFSARVVFDNGEQKDVIIEIQKAKFPTDIMRFRKYLGNRYTDSNNTYTDEDGRKHALPILTIYFLGHKLTNINAPVIKVARTYEDLTTGKEIQQRDEFIESLTHDSFVIQIPRLRRNSRNKLEKVLSVFEESGGHFLDFDEEDYPEEYREVIRRLLRAAAEPRVRQTMDVEDEVLTELESLERIAAKHAEIAEQERQRAEQAEQKAEQAERNRSIEIAKNLIDVLDTETIAAKTGLSIAEIKNFKP